MILVQNPVHAQRAPGTQISAFVQQSRIHFAWSLILKTLAVEFLANFDFLSLVESTWPILWNGSLWLFRPSAIETAPRHDQGCTRRLYSNAFSQFFRRLHQDSSLRLLSIGGTPSSRATFF